MTRPLARPQPNPSNAQHTFATHRNTPWKVPQRGNWLFIFFLCCLLKNQLWSQSQDFTQALTFCRDLSTCDCQLVISKPQCTAVVAEEEPSLTESSGCFVHVWTLLHPQWVSLNPQTTEMAAFPVILLGILLSLLHRFQKRVDMTWKHFMTVQYVSLQPKPRAKDTQR